MPHKQLAIERIKKEKNKNRVPAFAYMDMARNVGPIRVRCKVSGEDIKSMKPIADLSTERLVGHKTIIREAVALGENSNYAEIEILFDNGSLHHTPVSLASVKKLTVEDLETIYAADMEQWRIEEDLGFGKVNWELVGSRKPISYRRTK